MSGGRFDGGAEIMRKPLLVGMTLLLVAIASCSRESTSTSSASASASSLSSAGPPASASSAPAPSNDGTSGQSPALAPDDVNFNDTRKGWGWSDRCWTELKAGKFGWARAACDRGLALPQVDPKARAALLYNEGLIAKQNGDAQTARSYFAQSLALRPSSDPGRKEVESAFVSVGGKVEPKTFACGSVQCKAQGQICCDDDSHEPVCVNVDQTPEWCMLLIAQRSCDPKTNAPCLAGEKCCHVKIGAGPLTITLTCADAKTCAD
jgi:hypothetical protein